MIRFDETGRKGTFLVMVSRAVGSTQYMAVRDLVREWANELRDEAEAEWQGSGDFTLHARFNKSDVVFEFYTDTESLPAALEVAHKLDEAPFPGPERAHLYQLACDTFNAVDRLAEADTYLEEGLDDVRSRVAKLEAVLEAKGEVR